MDNAFKMTVGRLKEVIKQFNLDDSAEVHFIHREDLFDDEGVDYRFFPNTVWAEGEEYGKDKKLDTLVLVSVFDPIKE